jgi:hypothetical protein
MRDLNKYKRETNKRLVIGAIVLIFLIGDGLIFLIYGTGPGLMGLTCLLVGLVPVLLISLVIYFFDWSVKRANRN